MSESKVILITIFGYELTDINNTFKPSTRVPKITRVPQEGAGAGVGIGKPEENHRKTIGKP